MQGLENSYRIPAGRVADYRWVAKGAVEAKRTPGGQLRILDARRTP